MIRKIVTVDRIVDIKPIPTADFIEMVQVRNWKCVAKKGEFEVGDLCVYAEIDSLFPMEPRYEFLAKNGIKSVEIDGETYRGYRIRTQTFLGQIDQGLALPFSFFKEDLPTEIGTDITEMLGVVKWDLPLYTGMGVMNQFGVFPYFIPKTDEQRIQNINISKINGKSWRGFEKYDGTSATYFKYQGEFGVCCHEWQLKDDTHNLYNDMALRYKLRDVIPEGIAIQGEIVGPGVQGNKQKFNGKRFFLFHVFNIEKQCYIDWYTDGMFYELDRVPLKHAIVDTDMTIEDYLSLSSGLGKNSEGIVWSRFSPELNFGKESFKVINNDYLL